MKSVTRVAAISAVFFAAFSLVNAHGSVKSLESNGQSFEGPIPGSGGTNPDSAVRKISTLEPITDPGSPDMACGPNAASSAKLVAQVKAGSSVTFGWRSGESTPWPHRWGPTLLYAYQCPKGTNATDCAPPTGKEWTLIDAQGFDPAVPNPNPNGDYTGWIQDQFHHDKTVSSPVPANLPNGDYLFRHELIALHNGDRVGGAEYYVSCSQVRVTGGASGLMKSTGSELVSFPGAYSETDPGIKVNVFDNSLNAKTYKMPGPALFASTGSGGTINTAPAPGSGNNGGSPASTVTGSAPVPTETKSTSCKRRVKKRSLRKTKKRTMRKRHQARAVAAAEGILLRGKPKRIVDVQY